MPLLSPFSPRGLQLQGIGNGIIAAYYFTEEHNASLGVLFIALGFVTWIIAGFCGWQWSSVPLIGKLIAGIGALTGVIMITLFFAIIYLISWLARRFASR
jgi:hypothetical protein